MKRRHRKNYNDPGHAHELTFSCYKNFAFLKSNRTRRWLIESINKARRELRFDLWAYVFMPDHAHLIICPKECDYNIATIRRTIKSPVAKAAIKYLESRKSNWLPRITRQRAGKNERMFWQSGGGYDRNITTSAALREMIDYLHLNPVRKGLTARASNWRWSSAAWYERITQGAPLSIDPISDGWLSI